MYYNAKVREKIEDDKGKIKKSTAVYLVDAVSVTDVEVQITQEYNGVNFEWELLSVAETKICKILEGLDPADSIRA